MLPSPARCIAAGPFYSMFCTITDEMFVLGKNQYGQFGMKQSSEHKELSKSENLSSRKITKINGYLVSACKTGLV
jgi:alpha-tubulin suppressor-like RCC1 family protein